MSDQQKYTNKLTSKSVLIFGGTSGLGYGVAEACLENGARVTISSSQQSRVQSGIEKLLSSYPSAKGRVAGYACDLAGSDVEEQIKGLLEQAGKLDHIVCTAGDRLATMPIQEATLDGIQKASAVRFVAPLMVAKHAPRYLNPGPGSSITFTTGVVSEKPIPDWSIVAGYAAAAQGMVRNLALDLKPIRINLVSPGVVDTELWDHLSAEQRSGLMEATKAKHLTGEVGMPSDVAEAYLYFMRDRNVTGTTLRTDGGSLLV